MAEVSARRQTDQGEERHTMVTYDWFKSYEDVAYLLRQSFLTRRRASS